MAFRACSFTGHRQIEPAARETVTNLIDRFIVYAYNNGCREFYNGGAIGFDILAARRVLLFRISHPDVRLHMVLPCKNQSERWSDRDTSSYEYVLGAADTVEVIADDYYDGCMRVRNARLVELCDVLVAYVGRNTGGSAQTYRMAKAAGKTVYNLFGKK